MIQIIHIEGVRKGDIDNFAQDTVTFGRNPSCDVVFPADSLFIARKHAEISYIDGKYIFTNYGGNGSAVNGVGVNSVELQNGDVLTFSKGGPKASFLCKNITVDQAKEAPVHKQVPTNTQQSQTTSVTASDEIGEFTLQYGSEIKSFEKFAVSIGLHPDNDFPITHSSINEHHLSLFFLHNNYYVKDLNSPPLVRVNNRASSPDRELCIHDLISLSNLGPAFSYLGEGKFVEYNKKQNTAK